MNDKSVPTSRAEDFKIVADELESEAGGYINIASCGTDGDKSDSSYRHTSPDRLHSVCTDHRAILTRCLGRRGTMPTKEGARAARLGLASIYGRITGNTEITERVSRNFRIADQPTGTGGGRLLRVVSAIEILLRLSEQFRKCYDPQGDY
jgi:hypothetical protein